MSGRPTLSRFERIILVNQIRILEALYPHEASDLQVQREALERGYEMIYPWGFEHIYDGDDIMTNEDCEEVWDTLDMFVAIDRSIKEGRTAKVLHWTKFAGYDGNNEGKFMSFAEFTVEKLQRFQDVPMREPGKWNSHSQVIEIYRRMLSKWKSISKKESALMSQEQLDAVLGAAEYPKS